MWMLFYLFFPVLQIQVDFYRIWIRIRFFSFGPDPDPDPDPDQVKIYLDLQHWKE